MGEAVPKDVRVMYQAIILISGNPCMTHSVTLHDDCRVTEWVMPKFTEDAARHALLCIDSAHELAGPISYVTV